MFKTEEPPRMHEEIWRPVVTFGGHYASHYEVSSLGRVRRSSAGRSTTAGRLRRLTVGAHGYETCCLSAGGRAANPAVHRLVAEAFLQDRLPGQQINHIDGNKRNNAVANLEYVSCRENIHHSIAVLKNHRNGERNGKSRLTDAQAAEIRRLCKSGTVTQLAVSRAYNVSPGVVSQIVRNLSYKT